MYQDSFHCHNTQHRTKLRKDVLSDTLRGAVCCDNSESPNKNNQQNLGPPFV
jgi:hypothetical protein